MVAEENQGGQIPITVAFDTHLTGNELSQVLTGRGKVVPSETEIQNNLYFRFNGILMMPNSSVIGWESDFVVITRALLIHEFEIKRTRSDFFNDRKKERTEQMQSFAAGKRTITTKYRYGEFDVIVHRPANYFWYVTPRDLVTVDELPPNAGLMTFGGDRDALKTVRTAKRLHREKLDTKHIIQICSSINYRYWRYRLRFGQIKEFDDE
jgi:hypothetical protein